jgi:hypothetical protein
MSDKPREWGNQAKEQRDQAAEAAIRGLRALEPLVNEDRTFTENERWRREAVARDCLKTVLLLMVQAGAPVRSI